MGDMVGKTAKADGQIFAYQVYVLGDFQLDGGKVPNAANPCGHQHVGYTLGKGSRYRDDAYVNVTLQ